MRLYLSVIVVILILIGMIKPEFLLGSTNMVSQSSDEKQKDDYYIVTFQNDTGGWYFKLFKGDQSFINQKHIPAIQGTKAFVDSLQAAKVGNLMISKLDNGIFPPGISIQELDSLKIIY